jgi:putative transcriptional regulator
MNQAYIRVMSETDPPFVRSTSDGSSGSGSGAGSGSGRGSGGADRLDLTGKLLIAMPGMGDARFVRAVVFVCAHSEDGAMGLIINKPAADLSLRGLLEQVGVTMAAGLGDRPVHFGGPVEHGRGFVLHSGDYRSRITTLPVAEAFGMTATVDVLQDMGAGQGPERAIVALGYAGWGPGQLEGELAQNGWLTVDAAPDLVFGTPDAGKWEAALKRLGVDALALSSAAGRA